MAWTFYELRFRLLSPLHVGHQKIGNIQRTRHYVPARVLWGALTARLTRSATARKAMGIANGDYIAMGDNLRNTVAFSYFFPAVEGHSVFPSFNNGVSGYRSGGELISKELFAWRHLGSYASTALNYERNAAEDASLHEVEFIVPRARLQRGSQQVELRGYVIVAENCELSRTELETSMREIQLGGERRCGWGLLRLEEFRNCGEGEAILFDHFLCQARDGARPKALLKNNDPLLAHSVVADQVKVVGEIEPFVSRAWAQSQGAGQAIEFTDVCYAPGAELESEQPCWFEFTTRHIWKAVEVQTYYSE